MSHAYIVCVCICLVINCVMLLVLRCTFECDELPGRMKQKQMVNHMKKDTDTHPKKNVYQGVMNI